MDLAHRLFAAALLCLLIAGSTIYSLKAEAIRDWSLRMSELLHGSESWIYKAESEASNTRFYIVSCRVAGAVIAVALTAILLFVIFYP